MATWFDIPAMRDRYSRASEKLEILQNVEATASPAQKKLEAECWNLRKNAYLILVKARDEGYSDQVIAMEAAAFNWSLGQVDNMHLRAWLCK